MRLDFDTYLSFAAAELVGVFSAASKNGFFLPLIAPLRGGVVGAEIQSELRVWILVGVWYFY